MTAATPTAASLPAQTGGQAQEIDELFGAAGDYSREWSVHDRALGTTDLRTIATRLPRQMWACLKISWRASRRGTLILAACELFGAVFSVFGLLAVNGVLRALLAGGATPERIRSAIPAVILAGTAAGANRVAKAVSLGTQTWLEPAVQALAQDELFALTNEVELLAYEDGEFRTLVDTAQYGASWVSNAVDRLVDLTGGILSLVAVGGVLAVLHPILLVLLPLIVLPSGYAALKRSQHMYRSRLKTLTLARQQRQLSWLLTSADAAEEIRVHDAGSFVLQHYRRLTQRMDIEKRRLGRTQMRSNIAAGAATGTATASAYLLLGLLLAHGTIALAAVGTAAYALRTGTSHLSALVSYMNQLYELGLYVSDWERACVEARKLAIPHHGAPVTAAPQRIEAVDVAFTYSGSDTPALSGVNVTITAGQTIALVGHNGSGKTTLARILAGLYLPTGGHVAWDGIATTDINRRGMFSHVGLLSQGFYCWPFTATANIRIGRHGSGDPDAVSAAIRDAGADFVHDLPFGGDTLLCRDYTNGVKPSGGQWQTIALARSGYFRDGDVVILDEPTAALDPAAEIAAYEKVGTLLADKTVLFITHRLASVRTADYIYVLDHGRVVEQGSFEQLMAADAGFAELFRLQKAQFELGEQVA
ncbi:ABC transporter ATP-binding protein [Catenulispora yoronensis]|uniref:ABC transporter ATP-binding protein n=1 Tax=Catenulispora yoronensis TaxID=450799 RepID=A0ABP5FAG9_9ACTN